MNKINRLSTSGLNGVEDKEIDFSLSLNVFSSINNEENLFKLFYSVTKTLSNKKIKLTNKQLEEEISRKILSVFKIANFKGIKQFDKI